jgi:hypothetical protein
MFATHTLVAYPIVSKMGISKNQAVAVAVGGTILTDTAVLIILAVIMGNSSGNLNQEFWIRLVVSLAIFSFIMFAIIPRIAKWFFRKLESEKHSHYIFVLAVVFFAAFLAEAAGVEKIIGAFVAGLALNRLIPHSSALMNRIEFIGNSLFIPFFLISVGMLVDINVIFQGPTALIVAGTLTIVALFGKWFAALFTQWIFKYSGAQRQLIFGLSSAHAAATLAVILVGYNAGILDENILNGTIILILITCVVASFATEKASKKIAIIGDDTDSLLQSQALQSEHILVPGSEMSPLKKILDFAILIKDKKSANPVSVLRVVSNNDDSEINIIKARNELEEMVKIGSGTETKVNIVTTIDHNVASGIARTSREIMADIIVINWPALNDEDKSLREKAEGIMSGSDKSIFACHLPEPMVITKRIVVAAPAFTERENGFIVWLTKLCHLAQELSIPLAFFCNESSKEAIIKAIKLKKINATATYHTFEDWNDFLVLSREVHAEDLFVLISARRGSASYFSSLENIPAKIEKYFSSKNRLVIYPQQHERNYILEGHEDSSYESLNRSIESVQKLGREIGSIFKKDEDN